MVLGQLEAVTPGVPVEAQLLGRLTRAAEVVVGDTQEQTDPLEALAAQVIAV